eukprot:scaffold3383_cov17-Tisochrysis_lutea.AAC.1
MHGDGCGCFDTFWRRKRPRVFDRSCKSYVFALGSTGLKLQTPVDGRSSLGLAHPFLVIQVRLDAGLAHPFLPPTYGVSVLFSRQRDGALVGDGQHVTLELLLTDSKAARRRVILSTVFSEAKATALHCQ